MNLKPVTLMNKSGTNICWWNSFIQLFSTTRDKLIVNEMTKFINKYKCSNKNINNKI
jgi:N-glycosylase/DNA lyase